MGKITQKEETIPSSILQASKVPIMLAVLLPTGWREHLSRGKLERNY